MFMTQAQASQKPSVSGAPAAKPSNAKPPRKKAADMTEAEKEAAKAERLAKAKKVFIVVGEIHEFESVNKAEKFLNTEGAPVTYAVLRGNRIGTSKKVSLR